MCDGGRAPLKKIIRPFKNMLVSLDHKTCFWFFFLPAIMVLSSFAVTIWQRKSWILLDKIDSLFQLEWIFFLGTLKINANALSLIFFINANTLVRTWEKVPWRAILNICLCCELCQKKTYKHTMFSLGITQHNSN